MCISRFELAAKHPQSLICNLHVSVCDDCSYSTIMPAVCFQMLRVLASARVRLKLNNDFDTKAKAEDQTHGTQTGDAEGPNVRL